MSNILKIRLHKTIVIKRSITFGLFLLSIFYLGLPQYIREPTPSPQASDKKTIITALSVKAVSFGIPVHLEIPKLGISTAINQLGLTKSGNMEAPKDIAKAGWYERSPAPGNKGTAVIAGHVNGAHNQPGVFQHLNTLKPGDKIWIFDAAGHSSSFKVRETRVYNFADRPQDVFLAQDGSAHLNVITCAGLWDMDQDSFRERLVVFADQFDS